MQRRENDSIYSIFNHIMLIASGWWFMMYLVFGLAKKMQRARFNLWKSVKIYFNKFFKVIQVEVDVNIVIVCTSSIKIDE